jgi:hypothetical protein
VLFAFGIEDDGWLLVQEKDGGKVGYVPGNYVEVALSILSLLLGTDLANRLLEYG